MMLSGDPSLPKNGVRTSTCSSCLVSVSRYDVFGDGKTAVRGGFGIFFQDRLPGFFNPDQASFVPNTISIALTNPGM